jgi:hypothetical protein
MAWTDFSKLGLGTKFKVGQRVKVWSEGRVGVSSSDRYVTLVRVTDTLLTTDEDIRYNRHTGVQTGRKARCERRGSITRVLVEDMAA